MAKWANDLLMDLIHNRINDSIILSVCSDVPTTRDEAITTYSLININLTPADFTIADGDVSGRKVTISEKANQVLTGTGTCNHIALSDAGNLLYVTECNNQALVAGNTMTVNEFSIEVSDPS